MTTAKQHRNRETDIVCLSLQRQKNVRFAKGLNHFNLKFLPFLMPLALINDAMNSQNFSSKNIEGLPILKICCLFAYRC